MFWNIVNKIHQLLCFHGNGWMRRTESKMLSPETSVNVVRAECFKCGKTSRGWEIQGDFIHNREYIRTDRTWVKPKQRHRFQVPTYVEIKF